MSDSIKLPELPQAWGTMYGKYQDKELDGFTADQMRGYAQDAVIAALAAAPSVPDLMPVILWLENGCDPKEAAKELRIYQERKDAAAPEAPQQEGK